jgi:two-component system CitB family sensor kinase
MPGRSPRLATQALLAQVSVILVVLAAGFALSAVMVRRQSENQFALRALAVARTVADDPVIAARVASGHDPDRAVQRLAEKTREHTDMLFVVVTDDRGIRLSHPDPARIGQHVSTPPVLNGREVVVRQEGTLGSSARAKVPLRAADGRVLGEVSTGVRVRVAEGAASPLVRAAGLFCLAALLLGTAAAVLLARRLKRQTLGLEPVELADLLREQQAVLGGVGEGVLAVDEHDRIGVHNAEAARLLGVEPPRGTPLEEAELPPALQRMLTQRQERRGRVLACADRLLVVTAQPVRRSDRELGHVVTLRDRTEQDELERELRALRALSDALRAQAHEYTNRLHTLAGLLDTGTPEQARHYLRALAEAPLATEGRDGARIGDPYVRGLLAAKTATASEQGVELRVVEDSHLPGRLSEPLEVVSLLGNLLDNAVAAAARGAREPRWVETSLLAEADALHLSVTDSGDGIDLDPQQVFEPGVTTRPEPERDGHGIGLALARQLAAQHGGQVRLERAAGADHGAVFVAHVPGVVETDRTGART